MPAEKQLEKPLPDSSISSDESVNAVRSPQRRAVGAETAGDTVTGLEDLTPAELESVYVVQADAENDAHVTGAMEEPPPGIVISYMLQEEIR
jgi:hypothetical protein